MDQASADLAAAERTAVLIGLVSESYKPDTESREAKPPTTTSIAGQPHPRRNSFDPASSVGRALTILREEKRPMHANDLIKRIHERGTRVHIRTLTSSLSKLVRDKRVFTRPGPNVFGLTEWGDSVARSANGNAGIQQLFANSEPGADTNT